MINIKKVILEILSKVLYITFEDSAFKKGENIFCINNSFYSFVFYDKNKIEFKWQNLNQYCSSNFMFFQKENLIKLVCINAIYINQGKHESLQEHTYIIHCDDEEEYKIYTLAFLDRLTDGTFVF